MGVSVVGNRCLYLGGRGRWVGWAVKWGLSDSNGVEGVLWEEQAVPITLY